VLLALALGIDASEADAVEAEPECLLADDVLAARSHDPGLSPRG
jgi:hypothetical protein